MPLSPATVRAILAAGVQIPLAVPVSLFLPGQSYGPYESPPFGAAFAQWVLQATPISWPASGDVSLIYTETSVDNGATWQPRTIGSWGPLKPEGVWHTLDQGGIKPTDRVRFTVRPLQQFSANLSLLGIPWPKGPAAAVR